MPTNPDPGADLGERLASWLEDLDLVDALAGAGLPTMRRDCHGRAVWSDPGTGEPLTPEQLEQLDAVLHSDGTEPEHAVPVQLLQIARRARLREELVATECLDYEALAGRRGTSVDAARFAVHKAAGEHRLLVVTPQEQALVPAFQLTDDGRVRPELEPVLVTLLSAGMDPWQVWIWLTQPAGLLSGGVPQEVAADSDEADLVLVAARRLADRARASR